MKKRQRWYYWGALAGGLLVAFLAVASRAYKQSFFQKTATGLRYRVVGRGEGIAPQEGDMLLLSVSYQNKQGEVLFSTADEELPIAFPYSNRSEGIEQKDGGIEEAIGMLQKKGDRLLFKLSLEKSFGQMAGAITAQRGLGKEEDIRLDIQLQDVMTQEAYKAWELDQIAAIRRKQQRKTVLQLQKDTEVIVSYLSENGIVAQSTDSGLHYVIDEPGRGALPKQGDRVRVDYTGKLLNGGVFDTSLEEIAKARGIYNPQRTYEPIAFQLGAGQVIRGWEEGILLLRQGSRARLFIPSTLAYGDRSVGNGQIPPDSVLVYEVQLVAIQE